MINCEINVILTWSKNSVFTSKATRDADHNANPAVATTYNPANATFKTTDTKLYASVVTLSTGNDKNLVEQLRAGFKKTTKWNKYISEMTVENKYNNLNYLLIQH